MVTFVSFKSIQHKTTTINGNTSDCNATKGQQVHPVRRKKFYQLLVTLMMLPLVILQTFCVSPSIMSKDHIQRRDEKQNSFQVWNGRCDINSILQRSQYPVKPSSNRTETAVMCSIAVNEEAYIDEFVDYYQALGFHKIYIYDNADIPELDQWASERGDFVNITHFLGHTAVQ